MRIPRPLHSEGSAFSWGFLILTLEGFPAGNKSSEPLLHRIVLNMPKGASVLRLIRHDHDQLSQTEIWLKVPSLP
jgi:hypothetical protein